MTTTRVARRDPVRLAGWWLRWAVLPALLAVWASGNVDARSLPFFGAERQTAVLMQDGSAYFGHLDDSGETGELLLRDVYYFQDAKGTPTNVAVALVKRGGEAHEPSDGMRINRDRVLAIERMGPDSSVARAIAVERTLLGTRPGGLSLNPSATALPATVAAQRTAAEHAIGRGYAGAASQLAKLNTDLVLPVSKERAATITQKAVEDLHAVRQSALVLLGRALGQSSAEADAYARVADPLLEGQTFENDPGTLLAPDLNAVVVRASAFYTQVYDTAAKALTQPAVTPSPSSSPRPSAPPTIAPSPSPSPRP